MTALTQDFALRRWDLYEVDTITDSPNPYDSHQFGHPLKTRNKDLIHSCSEFNGMEDDQIETMRLTHGRYIGMYVHLTEGLLVIGKPTGASSYNWLDVMILLFY